MPYQIDSGVVSQFGSGLQPALARAIGAAASPSTGRDRQHVLADLRTLLRGRYDAAQTTDQNRNHWAAADNLSADAAASRDVRRTLRSRARYEVANNSFAHGMVLTLANDLVGTGPRLQLQSPSADVNARIEREFARWSRAVGLAAKLRTMRVARAQDGECFGVMVTNPALPTPVKLDLRLVEADRVTTPTAALAADDPQAIDGIRFDAWGNPAEYHVLRRHPGADTWGADLGRWDAFDRVSATAMLHWFRADRPGQHRGLPDVMPALPLFAMLRRFSLATLAAAETAAEMAVIMRTLTGAAIDPAEVDPRVTIDWERNSAIFAPEGWEPVQLRPEHPSTTYPDFVRAILSEIARCLNIPYAVAAGDSSRHNYASGRLDWQNYDKQLRVEQGELGLVVLDPVLAAWLREAAYVPEYGMLGLLAAQEIPHEWFYDGREHVDPAKEATAQAQRLANRTTNLAAEYARQGKDWETELRQAARKAELIKELGLSAPTPAPSSDEDADEDAAAEERAEEAAETAANRRGND